MFASRLGKLLLDCVNTGDQFVDCPVAAGYQRVCAGFVTAQSLRCFAFWALRRQRISFVVITLKFFVIALDIQDTRCRVFISGLCVEVLVLERCIGNWSYLVIVEKSKYVH